MNVKAAFLLNTREEVMHRIYLDELRIFTQEDCNIDAIPHKHRRVFLDLRARGFHFDTLCGNCFPDGVIDGLDIVAPKKARNK